MQEAHVAKLGHMVELLSRASLTRQHAFVAQGHAARAGDSQHLQKFTTTHAHGNIPSSLNTDIYQAKRAVRCTALKLNFIG
jgi:hypothetical protein